MVLNVRERSIYNIRSIIIRIMATAMVMVDMAAMGTAVIIMCMTIITVHSKAVIMAIMVRVPAIKICMAMRMMRLAHNGKIQGITTRICTGIIMRLILMKAAGMRMMVTMMRNLGMICKCKVWMTTTTMISINSQTINSQILSNNNRLWKMFNSIY
eukprot:UN01726